MPFTEIPEANLRIFKTDIPDDELKWHWDEEDRIVKVLSGENWKLQIDNELPVDFIAAQSHFIKAGAWHRLIKGTTNLYVEVKKL